MTGRSSFNSVYFYVLGDEDVRRQAAGITTNKSLFSEGVPVENGLYDPHYGTTELSWNCQTCFNNKINCPGHDGMAKMNYGLQNASFRKEIIKWLKVICHTCGEIVIKRELQSRVRPDSKLTEYVKLVRSGTEKYRKCAYCNAQHPWISQDLSRKGLYWKEYHIQGTKGKSERKEMLYNHEIAEIFGRISDQTVIKLGKSLDSHPRKFIVNNIKLACTAVRPEIRKIGGNRSTMSDITAHYKNIVELNDQIPKEIPPSASIDPDLHAKLLLIDLSFNEAIQGATTTSTGLRLVTNTNKVTFSLASRLPKKSGRMRGNLMGKRTKKMMRSVITGDKALRPDQVGVPKMMARKTFIPEVVRPWNRERLMVYYLNGLREYPCCNKVKRIDTGNEHYIDKLPQNYVLQDGDVVYRSMIDGDQIGFNREPSLTYSSIAVLNVKVISGLTLRINSAICVGFNADFDGDEMNGLVVKTPETIAETKLTSSIHQWFIQYKNSKPMYGLFQDAVIGAYEMTQSKVNKIKKFHAMNMCNRTNTNEELVFDKETYTGRELISMFIPKGINMTATANFYVPEFAPYFNYSESDYKVVVRDGKLESGVLDKATIGQDAEGGLFHIIYAERGPDIAMNTIYNMQQVINGFLFYGGATFGLQDIYLSKQARQKIKLETSKIIANSEEITKQLNEGKLIPPVGMTLYEYYEETQMSALDHGDEFIKPIMEEIDPDQNWLHKFIGSGSKGARSNMLAIFSSIGSIGIKGNRIKPSLNGRTSINFPRFDSNPISRGYNPANFAEGIHPITFPFAAMEARYELIEVALSTALAGTMNRNAVKNLESIVVSNLRGSVKQNRLVQVLYGETGFDPRKVEKVQFPTVKLSNVEFEAKFKCKLTKVNKKYQNNQVKAMLDSEFKQLTTDREFFRKIFLQHEVNSRRNFLMKDTLRMPVNISRIIDSIGPVKGTLDPVAAINLVNEYCDSIGYIYMNEFKRRQKAEIPKYITNAITLLTILIRSYLCTSNLINMSLDNAALEVILERITHKISESFVEYGTSIGIIAAQSMSEPITQYLLDAKHRSGLKKSKTNTIVRFDELLKNTPTEGMEVPQMLLMPRQEYVNDRQKVMEIANHIEMLPFERFVKSTEIFVEEFGKPVFPGLESESKLVSRFVSINLGNKVPRDLINWCIRFVLKEDELILKSMKIKAVYTKLMETFPYIYIVHSPQGAFEIVFRVYIRNSAFKKGADITENSINDIAKNIKSTVIRGTPGIINTNVISVAYSDIIADGSIEVKKMFIIETDGTNFDKILENKYLDPYQCVSTSIEENETLFGITAVRNKIIDELLNTLKDGANYEHASIYADEMTYSGRVTSVQRSGLGKRELDQVLLRASFGSPVQVLQAAAINSQKDDLFGMSAPMVMGTAPKFGTTFNDVIIDEAAVAEYTKPVSQILDEL